MKAKASGTELCLSKMAIGK